MKKRVVSWLLVMLMLASLLPTSVLAEMVDTAEQTAVEEPLAADDQPAAGEEETPEEPEIPEPAESEAEQETAPQLATQSAAVAVQADAVIEIGTPAELAALGGKTITGNYKLTDNIDMTGQKMSPIKKFNGTFDGDGHTISNLTIKVTSGSAGLFAETGSDKATVIKGLTLKDVSITSSAASTSVATGGLVGKVAGTTSTTATEIERCTISGTVTNTKNNNTNYPTYIGGLVGWQNNSLTVTDCSVDVIVNSSSTCATSAAGGLIGKGTSNPLSVTGCTSTGAILANKGYAGGFVGYDKTTSKNPHKYTFCAAKGTVTGSTTNNFYGFIYLGSSDYITLNKCTYSAGEVGSNYADTVTGLKKEGTPATGTVTITVVPADSALTWGGKGVALDEGVLSQDGKSRTYTFDEQTGEIEYSVINENSEYVPVEGKKHTVKGNGEDTFTVTLTLKEYALTFENVPDDATVTLYRDEEHTDQIGTGTKHSVTKGTYYYTVTGAFGFEDLTKGVVEVTENTNVPVTLEEAARVNVKFNYPADAAGVEIIVRLSGKEQTANEDGTYDLIPGGNYWWQFKSANYETCKGTQLVTEETSVIDVPTVLLPDGAGTEASPYQLTSADQLFWFAAKVNGGQKDICAVLTENIALPEETTWTPIGTSGNVFSGTFDGAGNTISGLSTTSGADYQGLFGYVSSGTIKNVIVDGTVSGKNCVGGIVGCIIGGTVTQCANKATVSGNNNVGGIVGNAAGLNTVTSCYNRGTVSGNNQVGGIIGNVNGTPSTIKYCYSTGAVSGSANVAAVIGSIVNGSMDKGKLFYLSTLTTDPNATAKTSTELKATLMPGFCPDADSINDGYPVLEWQVTTYTITLKVETAGASVTVNGKTAAPGANGTYTVKLPNGEYTYEVSAFGYETKTGSVTVNNADITVEDAITLSARAVVTVTFTGAEGSVTVTAADGTPMTANADKTFSLPVGYVYTWTFTSETYIAQTGTINLSAETASGTKAVTIPKETAPESTDGVYQLSTPAQLFWFAQQVNGGSTDIKAALTDNIDLADNAWTPIGTDSKPFAGTFDGAGYTVSGLNVSGAENAGLFGVAKNATIKNVVVQGSVSGTNAAGLLAKAAGECTISNCGSKADVTGTMYAGGILGTTTARVTVTGCYNSGTVSASGGSISRAGGIAGYAYGSNGAFTAANCYNTGSISSIEGYAAGITGMQIGTGNSVSHCYNAGDISGVENSKTGAISIDKNSISGDNCYLDSSLPAGGVTAGAKAMSRGAMQADALALLQDEESTVWKVVRGVNDGFPVLAWQQLEDAAGSMNTVPARFQRVPYTTDTGEESSLAVGILEWTPNGASSYTVTLWRADKEWVELTDAQKEEFAAAASAQEKLWLIDETRVIEHMTAEERATLAQLDAAIEAAAASTDGQALADAYDARMDFVAGKINEETDLGYYALVLHHAADFSGVKDEAGGSKLTYDLTAQFAAMEEGYYYATVAAETNSQPAYVSLEAAEKAVMGVQNPYDRMKAVTGVQWKQVQVFDESGKPKTDSYGEPIYESTPVAAWDARLGITSGQKYQLDLYMGTKGSGTFFQSYLVSGSDTELDLSKIVAAGKSYYFTVTVLADADATYQTLADSLPSAYSESIEFTVDPNAEPTEKRWVEISSAAEWIEISSVKDEKDSDGKNKQEKAWSQNYRLTVDIDFSELTAAQQAQTKSIGSKAYPFTGEFDGQGHTIKGLTLSNNDAGLFRYTDAKSYIHDVTIDSANVLFSDNAAVLVCNSYGLVDRCAVINTNITADTGAVLGGMVSRNYGYIRNSYVEGGSLTSNSTSSVGHAGFVGANEAGGRIENCWTSMNVSTQSQHAAGFVGLGYGGIIRNCFALGNVSANGYSGGFVGRYVYNGNITENCYAAGVVTVTGEEGNGFNGGNQSWSSFQYEQVQGTANCYFNSATASSHDYGAEGKSLSDMQQLGFLDLLDKDGGVWAQDTDKNNGLPYLTGIKVPETAKTSKITVQLAIATYDKETYTFEQMGDTLSVTMDSSGNTRVVDLLDAAAAQPELHFSYGYKTTSTFGRFIHTINDYAVDAPDGWMFTINDKLSNVSASLATVKDGDKVLWFEGTTENRFQGPAWDDVGDSKLTWETISTVEKLLELADSADNTVLSKNYKLASDLDLAGKTFTGIGSTEHPFTGRFDGQNNTISNVTVSGSGANAGFFNVIKGATVKNLNLKNVDITGKTNVGGLVGYAQAELNISDLSQNKASLIGRCTVTGKVTGESCIGGLVGLNEGATNADTGFSTACSVHKCVADVTVTGTGSGIDANNKLGGLVGENSGIITDSSVSGRVSGGNMAGGLAGSNTGSIYDSHASGTVSGTANLGGFVGSSTGDGTVKNCYSTGDVSGENNTGSFAGAINNADTAVGAGLVTKTGSDSQGYIGGFAGSLGGTVTGLANQITVKNVYGNCVTDDADKALNPIGNTSRYTTDSEKAALEQMQLTDWTAVNDKLMALFGVSLPGFEGELEKYHDISVPYGTAAGNTFSLRTGTAGSGVTAAVTVQENAYVAAADDGAVVLKVKHDVKTGKTFTATVALTCGGRTVNKTVQVTLLPQTEALMDTIAATLTGTKDGWTAMDMALYQSLGGKTAGLTAEVRQNVINTLITEAAGSSATASDRSRIEIVLRSLGVDTTKLYPVNSNTPVNNAAKLRAMAGSVEDYYTAPYLLLANAQGNVKLTSAQVEKLISVMAGGLTENNVYVWSWNGFSGTDYDTTATALAALQFYMASSSSARALADKLSKALQTEIPKDTAFGNANSDAMVILGLIAAGVDPYTVTCANGLSIVDDMLRFALPDGSGFGYTDNTTLNALATDQGFRALIALAQFRATGKAFNVYDFSTVKTEPSHATGEGETEEPEGEPTQGDDITVTVTITTPSGTWLSKSVTVKKGSTVYHAFVKALEGSGITAVGAAGGYVRSMTKDGVTYGEFTSGPNSGWLYKVNGSLPNVPLTQKAVADRDYVLWYYTTDWKSDPDAGKMAEEEVTAADVIKLIDAIGTVTKNSGNAIAAARAAYNKLTADQKALVTNYDKLVAAEAAYAELVKQQAEEDGREETAAAWRGVYSDVLAGVNADDLAFGSEWLVIALARSGKNVPDSYYDSVVKVVQEAGGELSDKKFTEYSRTILALTAIGKDPAAVGGYDLLSKLADMDDVTYQGLNGAIFALIALDSGKYDVPAVKEGGNQTTRDGLVAYILGQQLSDGGWALSGNNADPDMTAMALQALAPYRAGDAAVQTAVDKAIRTLSDLQQADGGYSSWGTLNSESCAQVLIALAALGIDPATDGRFVKNGLTVLDALLAYALDDGFRHTAEGKADAIATEQALCALTAYARLLDGRTSLYDMTDALDGQTADVPDDTATTDQQPAKTTPVVVWIALGAVAVGGGAALVATRRRRGK